MSMRNWERTDYLKYHVRQWGYIQKDIQAQFGNDVRQYIAWLVKCYPRHIAENKVVKHPYSLGKD